MIQVFKLSKAYAGRELFSGLSFAMSKGDKVGLLGRNGSGKSTLLKCILGEVTPDEGTISMPKGYRLGYLRQHIHFTESNILDEVAKHLPPEEAYAVYQAEIILMGLGFSEEDLSKRPEEFSGGYQLRIELAKVIVSRPDAVLLDEPTNYLDLPSIRWLEDYFKEWACEMILISHDREFLDAVCNTMILIHRGGLYYLKGSTEDIYKHVATVEEVHEKTRVNIEKKKAHMQKFIDRYGAKATKAAQAQSRLKAINKLPSLSKLVGDTEWNLSFPYLEYRGKVVAEIEHMTFDYGKKPIYKDFSFSLHKGEKIACIGQNGMGKSTLLRLLAGFIKPLSGSIQMPEGVVKEFFGQGQRFQLSEKATIEEEIQAANPQLSYTQVRQICGAMMFSGDLAKKPLFVLSGGEKSRVLLGKTIASKANLLILDEPTNHLDLESVEELIEAIEDYEGALVIVSHNEHLLKSIPLDRLVVFHEGKPEVFEGSYLDYLQYSDKHFFDEKKESSAQKSKKDTSSKLNKPKDRKQTIKRLEEEIIALEEKKEKLEAKLIESFHSDDHKQSIKHQADLQKLIEKLEKAYHKLEDLT